MSTPLERRIMFEADYPEPCGWIDFRWCKCGSKVTQGAPDGEVAEETCARAIRCDRTGQTVRTVLL